LNSLDIDVVVEGHKQPFVQQGNHFSWIWERGTRRGFRQGMAATFGNPGKEEEK
jgi:hypothetical protein